MDETQWNKVNDQPEIWVSDPYVAVTATNGSTYTFDPNNFHAPTPNDVLLSFLNQHWPDGLDKS